MSVEDKNVILFRPIDFLLLSERWVAFAPASVRFTPGFVVAALALCSREVARTMWISDCVSFR